MTIRALIKFFRKRISQLIEGLSPMSYFEEHLIMEIITKRNYVPNNGKIVFRSFNSEFKDWIFKFKPFCKAYLIFDGKSGHTLSKLKNLPLSRIIIFDIDLENFYLILINIHFINYLNR
jgi:hypothetical protein